jgi:anti-anti-sigma regulatory factor
MTLKIERHPEGSGTMIRLIGRIQAETLAELEKQIRRAGRRSSIDLEKVDLVDLQVVRFLGACEAQGIALLSGSRYIRDWIGKERD